MDFTKIFTSLPFSVAVSVVLFYALFLIVRKEIKQNDTAMQFISEANKKHIEDLQAQNERLTRIIADNTAVIAENTKVYKQLISLIEYIKNKAVN